MIFQERAATLFHYKAPDHSALYNKRWLECRLNRPKGPARGHRTLSVGQYVRASARPLGPLRAQPMAKGIQASQGYA